MPGLVIGIIMSFIIFTIILLNVDNYILFMNMDVSVYKIFTIYSVVQLFISLIFSMILNKLYFEDNNNLVNKYSLIFNLLIFFVLIVTSLITKNQTVIVVTTLIPLLIFTLYIFTKNGNKFKIKFNILKWIKYDSVELFNNIAFFLIFLLNNQKKIIF